MNVELLFPSKYIKAADLENKTPTVTIAKFVVEGLQLTNGKKEQKGLIYFKGKEKALVLSAKVNMRVLKHLFGAETDAWPGKQIQLYATRDAFMGKMVDCLRVRGTTVDSMQDFTCGNANYMRDLEEWFRAQPRDD